VRRRLIVTDSLFSMDGDLAPVAELVELAVQYDAILMLDEAHATGIFGSHGRGVAEAAGVEEHVPVRVGTLSKALGSLGGFVCGSRSLIEWLVNRARPYIFSTALPAACCAAAQAALEIVRSRESSVESRELFENRETRVEPVGIACLNAPQRHSLGGLPPTEISQRHGGRSLHSGLWTLDSRLLLDRAAALRKRLKAAAFDTGRSASQIIPVIVRTSELALAFSAALEERGWLVPAIRPPSVPRGTARLRISLSLAHDDEMLDRFGEDLVAVGRSLGIVGS
jgi:8-amino-7-oxononanoate synthase